MPHKLHIENGNASLFYVNEEPWHGLGTRLAEPATAEQAMEAAKLNWDVDKMPLIAKEGEVSHQIPDRFAIVRTDWFGKHDKPIFGIVGTGYTPLQNRDAFSFLDGIVGRKTAMYRTAGALGNGERVWVLAKLPSDIRVVGDDITEKFLLLSNSHDGGSAVQVKFTPIRVVCHNTLTMALQQGRTLRVPHTSRLQGRMQDTVRMLGIINDEFANIEVVFKAMAGRQLSADQLTRYLTLVFPDPRNKEDEPALAKALENRRWSAHFFAFGKGTEIPGVRGTLWAAYNGVAELTDHGQPQTGSRIGASALPAEQPSKRRLESAWFGEGYSAKVRAYRVACEWLAKWPSN